MERLCPTWHIVYQGKSLQGVTVGKEKVKGLPEASVVCHHAIIEAIEACHNVATRVS